MASVTTIAGGFQLSWTANDAITQPAASIPTAWSIDIASPVPLPASGLLMESGFIALLGLLRRRVG